MTTTQIKWHLYYCLILLLFCKPAYSQINFYGKVIDDTTDMPVPNASIYFNNTTIGTTTNHGGEFNLTVPFFFHTELVISCNGYEVFLYKPVAAQMASKRFVFKLHSRETEIENKLDPGIDSKKRWLNIFYKNVLGITEEAAKSTIRNEKSIYFVPGVNKTSFVAYADTPLIIINPLLGYKIRFNLVEFLYDEATAYCDFSGYACYEEMDANTKYIKNRHQCFYGSSLHFYRSLIANQLSQNGFGTFLQMPLSDSLIAQSNRAGALLLPEEQSKIVPITAQQILFIDSANNFSISVTGRLLVQYYKNPFAKRFLSKNISNKSMLPGGVQTYLSFKSGIPIGINNAGVLSDPAAIAYEGYWMYERLANTLPYDYQPE